MKIILNKITLTVFCMITVATLTFIGCKKTAIDAGATPEELKGYEADIKAQIAKLPEREKLPTQIFNQNIPVTTFLADENNKPLPAGTSPNGTAAACNFTTPAYCNLIQYARAYDWNASGGGSDGGYYLQFTYKLSWDNAIYVNTSLGYLKIYNTATNALVVNETIPYRYIKVVDEGPDFSNPGNNIYQVTFSCQTLINSAIVNGGTAYNVFTSALFGTTCNNNTNYLVGSAAVTSSGFTGASGNDPCKRNEKIICLLASSGGNNPTYRPSASFVTQTTGYNGYTSTFIIPDVIEVEYSTNGGGTFSANMTSGIGIPTGNYLEYNSAGGGPSIPWTSGAVLTSGTYNIVFRYKNWKYGDPARLTTPSFTPLTLSGTVPDCTNMGNQITNTPPPVSGYTYYYYGNVIIP